MKLLLISARLNIEKARFELRSTHYAGIKMTIDFVKVLPQWYS